jgi:membrane dipeptidase
MTDAEAVHRDAIVVDGHVHLTNAVYVQGIDPWVPQPTGGFDFARAVEGGLNVVVDHLFVEDRYNDYGAAVKQACRLLETALAVVDANGSRMGLARTVDEARTIVASGRLALMLALEGGFDPDGDLDVLRLVHRLGVRMVQLTSHDTTNAMVNAYAGEQRWPGGLSDHGRRVIDEMNRLGIVVDISHASDEAKAAVIAHSAAPVATSHNGLTAFADVIGNLDESLLRALAARGGVVGLHSAGWLIKQAAADWNPSDPARLRRSPAPAPAERRREVDDGAWFAAVDAAMRERWLRTWGYGEPWRQRHDEALAAGAPMPTVEEWAAQVRYVVDLVGDAHVALGLDLMAGGNWLREFDATAYPRLTAAMVDAGVSEGSVRNVLGENWLRIFDAARAESVGHH